MWPYWPLHMTGRGKAGAMAGLPPLDPPVQPFLQAGEVAGSNWPSAPFMLSN